MIRAGALFALLIAGTAALAEPPSQSLRPVQRGGNPVVQPVEVAPSGAIVQPEIDTASETARKRPGLFSSLRPMFRSRKVEREARAQRDLRRKGAVCGDLALQGEVVGRVPGEIQGCGIENAVRVRSVSGVALSTGALMDCRTADSLKRWMEGVAKPALARSGGGLKSIRVAAHYSCRRRNNASSGKISEHGKGRAIDISAFVLNDGREVSVLQGWNSSGFSRPLRQMHQGACGPFGTVLGPNADRFHRDHFHFDTARYRSGRYCK